MRARPFPPAWSLPPLAAWGLCVLLGFCGVFALASCGRPAPPELTTESFALGNVTQAGVDLNVKMQAYNPNGFDLTAQKVQAKITLDHKYAVGDVTSAKTLTLPAGQHTPLDVPLSIGWTDLPQVIALAAGAPSIPFDVDGTIAVGGKSLNVDVPFHLEGALTQKQLLAATKRSLPFPIP